MHQCVVVLKHILYIDATTRTNLWQIGNTCGKRATNVCGWLNENRKTYGIMTIRRNISIINEMIMREVESKLKDLQCCILIVYCFVYCVHIGTLLKLYYLTIQNVLRKALQFA